MEQTPSKHWLWRLSATDWIEAGQRELEAGHSQVELRRTAITHARRGAGMALNGVLVHLRSTGLAPEECTTRWGRSYIDHLRVLANAAHSHEQLAPFGPELVPPCQALMAVPVMPPRGSLIQLAAAPNQAALGALQNAETIVEACRLAVTAPS